MDKQVMKILFAINPVSGGKSKVNWENDIRTYFKNSPHQSELFLLNGNNDKASLKYWIDQWHPDKVIAVGGDGTIKLVAEQLLKTNIALGILPNGSANGMAKELNIPTIPEQAIHVAVNGKIKDVDVIGFDDNDISLHLSDIGLNADLIKHFEKNNWKGKLGYARGVLRVLIKKKLMQVTIQLPERSLKTEAFMVVLANAKTYGTGAVINPKGNLDDGLFEVVIVRKLSVGEIFKMFWKRKAFNPSKIEIFQVPSVIVEINKPMNFQVDGEYKGKIKKVSATVLKGQLKLIVPG
jgi:diacylglycerol kinase family enzyme